MTKLIDDATLAKLDAVEKKATPRPWEYDSQHNEITTPSDDAEQYWLIVSECWSAPDQTAERDQFGHHYDANFDLIAQGRNALPDLLATIRVLKAALEHIVALECKKHPRYPVIAQVVGEHGEFDVGVNTGRREAARIASAALRDEEIHDEATR